jgi:fibro-slime domain-containing protein
MLTRVSGTIFAGLCVFAWIVAGCGGTGANNSQFEADSSADATSSNESGPDTDADAEIGFFTGDGAMTGPSDATPQSDGCGGGSCFDGPVCGDGIVEAGEQCDDGNTVPGDGCNGVCQIEPGYECPAAGGKCVLIATCGNGVLDPGEGCDDGNLKPGDGCSSSCQVEPGWRCTNPPLASDAGAGDSGSGDGGAKLGPSVCVQDVCGDGIVETDIGETCDDGNTKSGDGCSSTCELERGWTCPTPDAPCATVCGDGIVVGSEQCDEGSANGAANSGCSSTCTIEPGWTCPSTGGECKTVCGDGIVAGNEQCDDGSANGTAGNGCSATCTIQPGFECVVTAMKSACKKTVCGNGIVEGTEECDDGNLIPYDGCSPTCTLEPKCSGGKCSLTAVCGDGIIETGEQCDDGNTVSGDGCSSTCQIENGWTCTNETQAPPASLTIPILYRDMLYWNTFANNAAPGNPDFNSNQLHTFASGTAAATGLVESTLGADNEPVWLSDYGDQPSQASFYASPTGTPTDAQVYCWWYHETGCTGAGSVNPYDQLVYVDAAGNPMTLTIPETVVTPPSNVYNYATNVNFFPLDNLGWNKVPLSAAAQAEVTAGGAFANGYSVPETSAGGTPSAQHNFNFTSELHYPFTYQSTESTATTGPTFTFAGDDDVWAFIGGKLVVDLGGVHSLLTASYTLTTGNAATLGLADGGLYSIDVFQAERHPTGSDYGLTIAGFVRVSSVCKTTCGDDIVAGTEQCDNGTNNQPPATAYGAGVCTTMCTLAPYCGDDIVQTQDGEQCDDGTNLATYGGASSMVCGPGCKYAPYCGDGKVQNPPEKCDNGANDVPVTSNPYGSGICTTNCTPAPYCGDGIKNGDEQCDDGVNNGSYGTCNPNCTLAAYCGDGIVNGSEKCDDGTKNVPVQSAYGPNLCTTACTPAPYCGDGIVEPQFGEQCDGTPGCTAACKLGASAQ